jgi:ribosome modulation factor
MRQAYDQGYQRGYQEGINRRSRSGIRIRLPF